MNFRYNNYLHEFDHIESRLVLGDEKRLSSPLVTVIMPIYNHPDFFRKSLSSVINQQCDFEYEIVIVDNGHPELQKKNQEIVSELQAPNIWYFVNVENIGGCANENRGIQLARGKFITFCHDDDLFYENTLQVVIDAHKSLKLNEEAVFGAVKTIDENDVFFEQERVWDSWLLKGIMKYRLTAYDMLAGNYSNGCSTLYDRECLLEIGGFCKDFHPCPDYALNSYYVMRFGGYAIRQETLKYRVSKQGDSSSSYVIIYDADKKIKSEILRSGLISKFFPRFIVDANLNVAHYHIYNARSETKPKAYKYFLNRLTNRIFLKMLLVANRFK